MGKPRLTEEDFRRAAKRLGCEVPAIKAVAQVESRGAGFYGDGFPVILFERHIFRKLTKSKYSKLYPHLSGNPGNYGPAGKNQRVKFGQAFELDPEAAMKSCSWGKFQIMGFNHRACGFATVGEFVDAMKESEGRQLDAFVGFVIDQRIDKALRNKNWTDFARSYNGKGYAKNRYDTKMAAAYHKFVSEAPTSAAPATLPSEKADTSVQPEDQGGLVSANAAADLHKPVETVVTRTEGDVTVEASKPNQQDVNQSAEVNAPPPQGIFKKLTAGVTTLITGTLLWQGLEKIGQITFTHTAIAVVCFVVLIAFLAFCFWAWLDAWKQNNKTRLEAEAKTAIDRKDIVWK